MTGIQFWFIVAIAAAILASYYHVSRKAARKENERKRNAFFAACVKIREDYNIVVRPTPGGFDYNVIHPKDWFEKNSLMIAYDKTERKFIAVFGEYLGCQFEHSHASECFRICSLLNKGLEDQWEAE